MEVVDAAESEVGFCSVELEACSPKIVVAVVVPADVLCTKEGPGTLYPLSFA